MVGRIIEFSARHRFLVLFGVGLAGLLAYWSIQRVKLDAIPDLSDPQVIIFSEWMGRSPTLVEDQVTYPLVSSLVASPKVTDVRGLSMFGMSFVYVLFEEGTDLYWARSRVLEQLSAIRERLPPGVQPNLGPDATGIGWVFQYALVDRTGKTGLAELRAYQDFTLRYALASVEGVAEVASIGGYEKQYQVVVDPLKLRALGVTLGDVIAAVRDSNDEVGGGALEMSGREYYIRSRGRIEDLAGLESVALRASGPAGTPVLVRDVASVRFGPEARRGLLEWNGEGETVGGIVVVRHGENALDVIRRVKQKLGELAPTLPPGVKVEVAYDRSDLIERSIDTLKSALFEEAIVVSLIIIIFLLHLRSSLLPILSLPLAVGLAFIPMVFFDIPSTIMSLGGIAIAIGAAVDAEIVMIEAAHKKLEHAPPGADRRQLLAEAAREVTPAIFFSLLIIAVAFLPVFALSGQAGRLFRPLAFTKTFVMLASAALTITFAPALRDLILRGRIRPEDRHPISRAIIALYKPFVYVALRRPKSTIAIGLFAVVSALPIALGLGKEFMPPLNEGDILYMPTTYPNLSIEEAKRQIQAQNQALRQFPEVESVFGKIGRAETATDPAPITMVETTVRLKPPSEWREGMTWDRLVAEMDARTQFPGWTNAWTMPIKTRIDMLTTGIRTPVGIKVLGRDQAQVEQVAAAVVALLKPLRGTRSIGYERSLGGLYVDVVPRPEALARYGLRSGDIARVVEAAIGGATISTTIESRERFSISVRYPQALRGDLEALRRILVPVGAGAGQGMGSMGGARGASLLRGAGGPLHAQAMGDMDRPASTGGTQDRPRLPQPETMSDVPGSGMAPMPMPAPGPMNPMDPSTPTAPMMPGFPGTGPSPAGAAQAFVPLGLVADVEVVEGPSMVRDENGQIVAYVSVDIDERRRDVGGYVTEAKEAVRRAIETRTLDLAGTMLDWTGQYEQWEALRERLEIIIPLTLAIVVLLLYWQFRNPMEVLIVLLSIPFALVGSVWLLWFLDYRLSTAVVVGIIALAGLAAQTGIIMIVYIDAAYERRRRAGKIRNLDDIIWAHMEGTVLRVRPKLMTVATMLIGLVPLLWATGSGADVMKRIAAPMVGGLVTSAFLTLEIIPVIYTYWRQEQLLLELLASGDLARARRMRGAGHLFWAGAIVHLAAMVLWIYLSLPAAVWIGAAVVGLALEAAGLIGYLRQRPAARRIVWPTPATP